MMVAPHNGRDEERFRCCARSIAKDDKAFGRRAGFARSRGNASDQFVLSRMSGLVDNVMELAQARLGRGIMVVPQEGEMAETLNQLMEELRAPQTDRTIVSSFDMRAPLPVDHLRIAQMVSNHVSNAVTHGAEDQPVKFRKRRSLAS